MGHHIVNGRFQSDKYPDLPPDKIILSFKDPRAWTPLRTYATLTSDTELAEDILHRLKTVQNGENL